MMRTHYDFAAGTIMLMTCSVCTQSYAADDSAVGTVGNACLHAFMDSICEDTFCNNQLVMNVLMLK